MLSYTCSPLPPVTLTPIIPLPHTRPTPVPANHLLVQHYVSRPDSVRALRCFPASTALSLWLSKLSLDPKRFYCRQDAFGIVLKIPPQRDIMRKLEETVAEDVAVAPQKRQASAKQVQQLVSQPSPPVRPVQNTQSSTIDELTCRWQGCDERCDSADALYVSRQVKTHGHGSLPAPCRHSFLISKASLTATSAANTLPESRLRTPYRPQEHKQPQPHLPMGRLPYINRQA